MDSYVAEKHWFVWLLPGLWSLITCFTIIIPLFLIGYTFLRCKLDRIEVKDGCLYSRMGLFFIDKKTIPLNQISFINIKADIISEKLNVGSVIINSSAFSKTIMYPFVKNPEELVNYINEHK